MLIGQVGSLSRWPMLVLTVVAFAAAALAAVRADRARSTFAGERSALPEFDLLASDLPRRAEPRPVRVFGSALAFLLVMYALFDRAFAWVHLPGTPLFVGEAVIGLGLLAMASSRVRLGRVLRRQPALGVLSVWMVWGLGLLALGLPAYGLDAVRDSAIWYYGIVALFAVFLMVSDPSRLGRWVDGFRRAIPIMLIWFPVAIVLRIVFTSAPPYVPGSQVSVFSHRSGNIAVFCAIVVGFIWLVDREEPRLTPGQRVGYSILAVVTVLVAGVQNRGGMVAALCGIMAMMFLMRRRRAELGVLLTAVVVSLVTVALIAEVRVPLSGGREISASQLADNLVSIIQPDAGGERQRVTTEWRLELWGAVLDDIVNEAPVTGFGPGPDLGDRYGVGGDWDREMRLRNPHNSHLGVAARMGLVGAGLWFALWSVWVITMYRARARFRASGRAQEAGFVGWLVVSAMMILINAVFDPTLEGPQVGFPLWMIFGVGVGVAVLASSGPRRSRRPAQTGARVR